ncbi:hypothetical protein E8E14_004878 [Neopestalotiopsis sp. 37M]|nr:hypothetical protein E8E14_004878 [Neopestalotiopsis sp. 37M]
MPLELPRFHLPSRDFEEEFSWKLFLLLRGAQPNTEKWEDFIVKPLTEPRPAALQLGFSHGTWDMDFEKDFLDLFYGSSHSIWKLTRPQFEYVMSIAHLGGPREFLAATPLDFYDGNYYDLLPEQLTLKYTELDQVQSARFQASFASTGNAGVHAQGTDEAVTSNTQLQDGVPPSLLPSSSHDVGTGNSFAEAETPPQAKTYNASIPCQEPRCQSSFGTERELRRHQESIHSGLQIPCTVAGCKRGPQKPFNRPDNLHRHMQRVHGQDGSVHTVSFTESSRQGRKRQIDTVAHLSPVPEDKRRRMGDSLAHTDAQGSSELMVDHSEELARLQRQLEDAVAENQSLKDEVRSLKERIKKRDEYVKDLLTSTD